MRNNGVGDLDILQVAWAIPRNCGSVIYSEYAFKGKQRWVVDDSRSVEGVAVYMTTPSGTPAFVMGSG
jgi:hypothetical protein